MLLTGDKVSCTRRRLGMLALLCTLVLLYYFVDIPLARATTLYAYGQPRIINNLFEFVRLYGQLFSIILTAALILSLDPSRRKELGRLVLAVIAVAVAVNVLKVLTGRARPRAFLDGRQMWSLCAGVSDNWYTSFPSAHTAGAFALTAVLRVIYPRARSVFFALAILCAISRLGDLQHWASDVVAGAALGFWLASGVFASRWGLCCSPPPESP